MMSCHAMPYTADDQYQAGGNPSITENQLYHFNGHTQLHSISFYAFLQSSICPCVHVSGIKIVMVMVVMMMMMMMSNQFMTCLILLPVSLSKRQLSP
jgi:hypothetical protein